MPLNKPSDFFEQKENEENLSDEKTKVETQKRILSPSGLLDEKEEVVVEENIEEEEVVVVDNIEDKNYQKIIELEKLVEQVKSQVSSIPKVIDYRKDIGQLSIELDRLRKAFGLSEAEKLLSKPVEFPEIKSYDEDIELLHKLVADIERKQEIVSLSEGLLDEPNSDSEKNFATLEDLSEHYRLFVNRIQQQLSTLGGGGIEDAPKSGGPYVRQGQKWIASSSSDGDWIRDSVGINTTDSVGIGTTAKSGYQLYVGGNARVTGVLTVGQESITLNGDTNTLDLGGSSISKDSGGDLKIMGSGGGYAPVRASEFKINADTVIDGNKNISAGIVTGVTYYGDGSNLTGIIAVGIGTTASINTSGIITASVLSSTTGTFGTVNVSGASTFSDEVSFGSTVTFGTASQNIKIYTNSTGQSTIQETGGGNLKILGNKMVLKNSADTKIFSEFVNGGSAKLYYNNSEKFETTGVGVSILNGTSETATIYGPSNLIIDPMPVGVGTTSGIVRIKGDLYVDGTTTTINSTTVEIADKVIGIATTCNTNLLTDGAGIGIGSDKTFLYHYNSGTNPSLKASENLNVPTGKGYQVNQVEVLNATTLGSGVTVSSLTSVGTLGSLNVSGISTFAGAIDANGDLDVDGHTELDNLNVSGIATFNGGITAIFGGITVNGGSLNLTGSTADLNVDGETDLDVTRIAETLSVGGISTFGSIIDANGGLDVSQHTELDRLNVSGISTFEGKVNADAGLEVSGGVLTANNNINTYAVRYALSSNTRLAFDASNEISLRTGSGSIFKVKDDKVGINSTTPTANLDVVGNAKVTGIITASSFFGDGSALTGVIAGIGTTASINTSGIITATSFSGDGSNLTGVIAGIGTTASINTSGIITATSFSGDGSALTGIASAVWSTNGNEAYYTSGNVGIGTTNPNVTLDVNGKVNVFGSDGNGYSLVIDPSSSGGTYETLIGKLNGDLRLQAGAGVYQANRANILLKNNGNLELSSDSSSDIVFKSNTVEKVRIDSAGNVGIGTDSPVSPIHIVGTNGIKIDDSTNGKRADFRSKNDVIEINGYDPSNSNAAVPIVLKQYTNERLRIDSNGDVGIGTTNPKSLLHVYEGSSGNTSYTVGDGIIAESDHNVSLFLQTPNDKFGAIQWGDTDNHIRARIQYDHPTDAMLFKTNGNIERVRIDSNGNVGIGTDNPNVLLDIRSTQPALRLYDTDATNAYTNLTNLNGNMYLGARNDSSDGVLLFGGYGGGTFTEFFRASSTAFTIDTNGNERFRISSAGNVGIGSTQPTAKLDVDGTVNVTGVSTFSNDIDVKRTDGSIRYINFYDQNGGNQGSIQQAADGGSGALRVYGKNLLRLASDADVEIVDGQYNTKRAVFGDAGVELYSGVSTTSTKKFETTGYGVTVYGGVNVSGVSTFTGAIDATSATIDNLTFTSGTAITSVDTDLSTVSGSDDTLASAKAIKAYVDSQSSAQDLDFAGDSGTGAVGLGTQTFTIAGTTNEIETVGSGVSLTVGLPNQVAITTSLTVASTTTLNSTGIDVTGHTETDTLNVSGVSTFQNGIDITGGDLTLEHSAPKITLRDTDGTSQTSQIFQTGGSLFLDTRNNTFDGSFVMRGQGGGTGTEKLRVDGAGNVGIGSTQPTAKLDVNGTLNVSGVSTFQGNVNLGDNNELRFGAGNDLKLWHNGFNSIINDEGVGDLYLGGNSSINITNAALSEFKAKFITDGAVELYHDASKKFETTSTGIDVTGHTETDTLNVSGLSTFKNDVQFHNAAGLTTVFFDQSDETLNFSDSAQLRLGDGGDLQLFHNGSASLIRQTGTGSLYITNTTDDEDIVINTDDGSGGTANYFRADGSTGEAKLYHYGAEKLTTKSNGIDVTGHTETDTLNVSGLSTFQDDVLIAVNNKKLTFGTGSNLQIYHIDNTDGSVIDATSNVLTIGAGNFQVKNSAGTKISAYFRSSFGQDLYYNNSLKFVTTGIGVSIANGTSDTATIAGPETLILDPAAVGDNTGTVRIKGDFIVDGTTTTVNSTTVDIADKVIGIATTCSSDLLTDGAGIGIGTNKTFLYEHNSGTNPSLKASENLNVPTGKGYQVNQVEVLNATTLGSSVVNSSLTSVGTLGALTVSGDVSIADKIIHTGDTDTAIRFPAADTFTVETAGTERVRVDSDGDVGVGIADPKTKLHVARVIMATGATPQIRLNANDSDLSDDDRSMFGQATGNGHFVNTAVDNDTILRGTSTGNLLFGVGTAEKFRIASDGKFGFGTGSSIDERGHIETSTGTCRLKIQTGDTSVAGFVLQTSAIRFDIQAQNNFFQIYDNTVDEERLRITSAGNVGIGTLSPTQKLDVAGNIAIKETTVVGSATSSLSTVSQTAIHSAPIATYRSVEYTIQATQGTNFHVTKILAVHDGTTAYNSEYGTIFNNSSVATFDTDVSGGNLRLLVTGASASQTDYVINFVGTKV